MSIISKSQLSSYRNKTTYYSSTENIKLFKSKNNKVTIFLSHKHDETEELNDAISLLNTFGVEIYVDWLDEEMPETTSGITAQKIKEKIKENRKFIFLATENAIKSKWCNWELGYGDAQKYIQHIALLPIKNNYSEYSGAEYLQIYPYIYKHDIFNEFYIKYPNGHTKSKHNIEDWLKL